MTWGLAAIDGASNHAERELRNAINADGGRALAAHLNGQTKPCDEIARLIAAAKVSSESAAATKTALPYAESLLENAQQQLASLIDQRAAEVTRVIATLADADVRATRIPGRRHASGMTDLSGLRVWPSIMPGRFYILEEPPRIDLDCGPGANFACDHRN